MKAVLTGSKAAGARKGCSHECDCDQLLTRHAPRTSPPRIPRSLFLGDYIGLETSTGDNTIAFFPSTISDGADIWSRTAIHSRSDALLTGPRPGDVGFVVVDDVVDGEGPPEGTRAGLGGHELRCLLASGRPAGRQPRSSSRAQTHRQDGLLGQGPTSRLGRPHPHRNLKPFLGFLHPISQFCDSK